MINKPKIHAFCDAGCKWETVHKSDFLASAPLVRMDIENGVVPLLEWSDIPDYNTLAMNEQYGTYIIHDATTGEVDDPLWSFSIHLVTEFNGKSSTRILTIPSREKYNSDLKFRICYVSVPTADGVTIVYEVDDVRRTYTVPAPDVLISDANTIRLYVQFPTTQQGYVNRVNEGATVLLNGGAVSVGSLAYASTSDAIKAICAEEDFEYPFMWIGADDTLFENSVTLNQGDVYSVAIYDGDYSITSLVEYANASTGGTANAVELTDTVTGTKYTLTIADGKLTLTETE